VLTDNFRQDAGYALRHLRREPGFAAAAIGILAIGIAACTVMFSMVQAVLLAPLGVDAPNDVVIMWPTQNGTVGEFPYRASRDLRARMRAFEQVALISSTTWGGSMVIEGGDPVALSGAYFDVLRARPLLGRTFCRKTMSLMRQKS